MSGFGTPNSSESPASMRTLRHFGAHPLTVFPIAQVFRSRTFTLPADPPPCAHTSQGARCLVRQVARVEEAAATSGGCVCGAEREAGGMKIAGAKRGRRVGIVYSNVEANQVATIGLGHGVELPMPRPGAMAHGSWDVNLPLKSHHLREMTAPVPHLVPGPFDWIPASDQPAVDDVLHMPRPGGFVQRPRVTPRRYHGIASTTP
jgi:hypothetical protein